MKLKTQTIVGFFVGVGVGVAAILIFKPNFAPLPRPVSYSSMKIDGGALTQLYNGNFSKLTLRAKTNLSTQHVELIPEVFNSAGGPASVPLGLIRVLSTHTDLPGTAVLPVYNLEHNRLPNHYLQLQTLVSIISNYPAGYFILTAGMYDATHIKYQIKLYTSGNIEIPDTNVPARALELDPCPPARQY